MFSWEYRDNSYESATTFLSLSQLSELEHFRLGEKDSFLGHIKNNGREYVSTLISMLREHMKVNTKLFNV